MACDIEFVEFVCSLIEPLGAVRYRKMMGDYIIYLNEKSVITACDNIAYIKKLPCIADQMLDAEVGYPYPGAKEAYILNLEKPHHLRSVISILWENFPFPKKKSKST